MAKNRNKKKRSGDVSMDITEPTLSDIPQGMDTSESVPQKPVSGVTTSITLVLLRSERDEILVLVLAQCWSLSRISAMSGTFHTRFLTRILV
ncbi:conserved hypothetical protein [Ricinus communis]|uniref:Uncharacterized protein n=1 Tax=Ricinus communis TaxID=3988 RepID=B9SID6_RICCO|nr:conserved hypothetical protein [Ricinus communis]